MNLITIGKWSIGWRRDIKDRVVSDTDKSSIPYHCCADSTGKPSCCVCSMCMRAYREDRWPPKCLWCSARMPDEIMALLILHNEGI